jgi:hypothetical protein
VDIEMYVIISKKPMGKQLKWRYKSNKNNFVDSILKINNKNQIKFLKANLQSHHNCQTLINKLKYNR